MEGNVAVQGIDRSLISNQGIIKQVVNGLRKRKKSNKEMKQVPKQQPKQQVKPQPKMPAKQSNPYNATKEDIEFSKRSGIELSEVMAQGGVTPKSVTDELKKYGAYSVRFKPSGLYKKPAKKK